MVESSGNYSVYGGVGGGLTGGCASPSGARTCNNCNLADTACNESRIYDALQLQVTFKVDDDSGISNETLDVELNDSTNNRQNLTLTSGSGNYSAGDTVTFTVEWDDICTSYGVAATCEAQSFKTEMIIDLGGTEEDLDIYVHTPQADVSVDLLDCTTGAAEGTADGICFFHAYPGDKKIFYTDIVSINEYPDTDIVDFIGIRVFISDTNFADANYNSTSYQNLSIPDGDEVPDPNLIEDLENGRTYWFRSAMIDRANNIAYLQDPTDAIDNEQASCDGATDTAGDITKDSVCDMMATPSAVYGLLNDEINCFISTAAYGSHWRPNVQTFRRFRGKFLSGHPMGEKFIKWYYKHGEAAADFIAKNETLRSIARIVLLPFLWFAKASLNFGITTAFIGLLSIITLFASSFGGIIWWRKRRA